MYMYSIDPSVFISDTYETTGSFIGKQHLDSIESGYFLLKEIYNKGRPTIILRPVAFRHPISRNLVFSWTHKYNCPLFIILKVFESSRGIMLGRFWVFGLIPNLQEGADMISDFLPIYKL